MRTASRYACILVGLLAFTTADAADRARPQLIEVLGGDFNDAKLVSRRGGDLVTVRLKTMQVGKLASFSNKGRGLSRPWWSRDGKQIVFSHNGKAFTMNADGSDQRRILENQKAVYEPIWWDDPNTGEPCIVFMTASGKHWYGRGRPGYTYLYRLQSRKLIKLADFPCDGGLSRDGTHLGEAYGGCMLVDVLNQNYHKLYGGKQACNASISPDNTYRLMHLYLPHAYFGFRNKFDKQLWRITKPKGTSEWQSPRWSNHPNFCMATLAPGYYPVLVQIDTKRIVPLKNLGNAWGSIHLWLPSAAGGAVRLASPIKDLPLKRLGGFKQKVALAASYTPIIDELKKRSGEPEARQIVKELEGFGTSKLKEADSLVDAIEARGLYRELAVKYRDHPIGIRADRELKSDAFKKELAAAPVMRELLALEKRLRPVKGAAENFDNPAYLTRNQGSLVHMVGIASTLLIEHRGTRAARNAGLIAAKYKLPARTSEAGNVKVIVEATVRKASKVPSAAQIKPYTEAVTYIHYTVDKVLSGKYDGKQICIVHWGMRDAKHTEAASWIPGTKQRITADLFDFHRELHKITAADDAYDFDLNPFWAVKVESLGFRFNAKNWPGPTQGLVLAWRRGIGLQQILHPSETKQPWRLEARGRAKRDESGRLLLNDGAFVVQGCSQSLLDACKKSNQLSIEAVLTSASAAQSGPARIISFSSNPSVRNFTLGQEQNELVMRVRTPRTGRNGGDFPMCRFTVNRPHHVIVSYANGKLVCYLDGKKAFESSAIQGDFRNWDRQHLLFGDEWGGGRDWRGTLERIAIFSRTIGEGEARKRFALAHEALNKK